MELRLLRYFVAVAEAQHVGRAAERLQMTQPPLSRALRQLERELGSALFERSPHGVVLTRAGEVLLPEARAVLERADRLRDRMAAAAGTATLAVGTLADTVEHLGAVIVTAFRRARPDVVITLVEADLGDPSAGLRSGRVDVALTRMPFDSTGLALHPLRSEPVGVVLPADDPLAARHSISTTELADRRWVQLPEGADGTWRRYWSGTTRPRETPDRALRTIQECLQAVLWNGAAALAPVNQQLPDGLVLVPVTDRPPSQLVVAWRQDEQDPLIRVFITTAVTAYQRQ